MIVFVLKLENEKYFIGHTYKTNFNFSELNSNTEWKKKYKPIEIIDILENCSFNYYVNVINIYSDFFGIKNVYFGKEFNICDYNEKMNDVIKKNSRNFIFNGNFNSFDTTEYK